MSCSESGSEDDFESADEGDSTDDYVIVSNVISDQIQVTESIPHLKQEEKDAPSGPTLDDKPTDPVNLDCGEFSEKTKLESEDLENECSTPFVTLGDKLNLTDLDHKVCSEETKHDDEESENDSCIEFITVDNKPSPVGLILKASSENVSHEDSSSGYKLEDPAIPVESPQSISHSSQKETAETTHSPEIPTKVSTRKISSRVRRENPRSTLGAKKLGAIRIPNQPSNSETFPTDSTSNTSDYKKESADFSYVAEVPSKKSHSQAELDNHPVEEASSSGGWGWFSPPTSLLSSVSALTTQILSTVETGFNIPEPEELAKEDMAVYAAESEDRQDDAEETSIGFSQLVGGVSNLTRFVENTGSMVFSSGLDTLELIGKKTYTALQQSDPGFKKTKAVLSNPVQGTNDLPSLSQVLRDAKEQNVTTSPEQNEIQSHEAAKELPLTLNSLLDQFHCFAHVEALEILSQQCSLRISSQMHRLTTQRKAILGEIQHICTENPDENYDGDELFYVEVLEKNLSCALTKIGIQLSIQKLIDAFTRGTERTYENVDSSKEIYEDALRCLAEITSLAVELMHKCAEQLLMPRKVYTKVDVILETQVLQNITFTIVKEISNVSSQFASQIIQTETKMKTSSNYSTDIYYEASNCSTHLQNALKSLSPVLKTRIFQ